MRFDHVVYAVPSLDEATAFFRGEWGLHVVEGGDHSLAPSRKTTAPSTYGQLQHFIAEWMKDV